MQFLVGTNVFHDFFLLGGGVEGFLQNLLRKTPSSDTSVYWYQKKIMNSEN